jgi:hypothetical protein
MSANQTNFEAPAAQTSISRELEAQSKNFGQHQHHDGNDSFTAVHKVLKSLSTADRQAIFNKMSPDQEEKLKDLPDLKLTGHTAWKDSDKPDAKSGASHEHNAKLDATHDAKPDSKDDAKIDSKTDSKTDAKHDSEHGKGEHLKKGVHPSAHKFKGLAKEIPGSTNYTLREHDEAHPGQIVERTYDKDGKLIPDAPVKVVEKDLDKK